MKASAHPTVHGLRSLTCWLASLLFLSVPAWSQTTAAEISVEGRGGRMLSDNGSPVALGTVTVGETGIEYTFTIRNIGVSKLTGISVSVEGDHPDDFQLDSSLMVVSVNGGSSTSFHVAFSPQEAGSRSAVLRITSNDSDENPFEIGLVGTGGVAPELDVRSGEIVHLSGSTQVIFGYTTVGQIGADRTITLHNIGSASLTGVSASLQGADSSNFELISPPASSIAPDSSSPLVVRFKPTIEGHLDAVLRIASNDSDENPFEIQLIGTGSEDNQPIGPEIQLVQGSGGRHLLDGGSSRNLGTCRIGKRSKVMTFKIENTGTGNLTKLRVGFRGKQQKDFVLVQKPTTNILAPGGTTSFKIAFSPRSKGVRSTTLQVFSNDEDSSPFTIALSGRGKTP